MRSWSILPLAVGLVAGCQVEANRYSTQPLGGVEYAQAFKTAQDVLSHYFQVASADAESGKIVSRPKTLDKARPDRLLGGNSSARQVATLVVYQSGGQVYADVSVQTQRQDVAAMRQMQPVTVDTENPAQTRAGETAAVSAGQNQAWQNAGRDYALERTILNELAAALGGAK
jgi:hypothetical protein